jgi:hypothetical protein
MAYKDVVFENAVDALWLEYNCSEKDGFRKALKKFMKRADLNSGLVKGIINQSQQPTVDVAKEIADDVQQTLECSDKYRNVIEKRISEALRGTYTREEMRNAYSGGWNDAEFWDLDNTGDRPTFDKWLTQYDTERNTK